MSNEIADRLRSEWEDWKHTDYCDDLEVLLDAASEIDSLEVEVRLWRGIAERFAESDPRHDAFLRYFRSDDFITQEWKTYQSFGEEDV